MVKKKVTVRQPDIGDVIRNLRQEMQLTQEKFAAKIGVSFSTLNRWENGKATPSPLAIERLEGIINELQQQT